MPDTSLHIPNLVNRGKWHDYRQGIWGDSYNWDFVRSSNQILYPTIHHSVTSQDATPDDIALLHKARGWGGIGYHFVITADGVVHYVGDVGTGRANVANRNQEVIGICLIGDFTKHLPTDAQIESAHDLVKFFIDQPAFPNVKSWDNLRGHKDLGATACPGSSWPNDMRDRIRDRRIYTPQPDPDPQPPTDPTDWEAKYNQEAKNHEETRRQFDEYEKKFNQVTQDTAVKNAVAPLQSKIDQAINVLS